MHQHQSTMSRGMFFPISSSAPTSLAPYPTHLFIDLDTPTETSNATYTETYTYRHRRRLNQDGITSLDEEDHDHHHHVTPSTSHLTTSTSSTSSSSSSSHVMRTRSRKHIPHDDADTDTATATDTDTDTDVAHDMIPHNTHTHTHTHPPPPLRTRRRKSVTKTGNRKRKHEMNEQEEKKAASVHVHQLSRTEITSSSFPHSVLLSLPTSLTICILSYCDGCSLLALTSTSTRAAYLSENGFHSLCSSRGWSLPRHVRGLFSRHLMPMLPSVSIHGQYTSSASTSSSSSIWSHHRWRALYLSHACRGCHEIGDFGVRDRDSLIEWLCHNCTRHPTVQSLLFRSSYTVDLIGVSGRKLMPDTTAKEPARKKRRLR